MDPFHHPDFSLPVVARHATAHLLDALAWYGEFLMTRGHSAWRAKAYRSRTAYWNAVSRLRRQGLVAYTRSADGTPILRVSPVSEFDQGILSPEMYWNRKWNGRWYVLAYDVPERNRRYRDHLRKVLLRHRCGCLQGSVWISTQDVRPLFADLDRAAGLGSMAHLFEARTVLGRGHERLVREAWDFDLLGRIQERYLGDCDRALAVLENPSLRVERLARLALDEIHGYRQALALDPLLPNALHPDGYNGRTVAARHRSFVAAVSQRTRRLTRTSHTSRS